VTTYSILSRGAVATVGRGAVHVRLELRRDHIAVAQMNACLCVDDSFFFPAALKQADPELHGAIAVVGAGLLSARVRHGEVPAWSHPLPELAVSVADVRRVYESRLAGLSPDGVLLIFDDP
jgi:hypothetical protein